MTSYLLAGPAEEPVSLAEAKAFLRVADDAEDGFVTTLIVAARLHVEAVTGQALIAQEWRLALDGWPAGREVPLPVAPLRVLDAVTAYDDEGAPHVLPLVQFMGEVGARRARIRLPRRVTGMPRLREQGGIEIDFTAGHGADASEVPGDLKRAVLALVGHWFEHREAVVAAGGGAVVPAGFDRLVAAYRGMSL